MENKYKYAYSLIDEDDLINGDLEEDDELIEGKEEDSEDEEEEEIKETPDDVLVD